MKPTHVTDDSFAVAIERAEAARIRSKAAGAAMNAFPRGPMGLTPDAVKASPLWRAAKTESDAALAAERAANAYLTKHYPKQLRAYHLARRAARVAS